MENQGMFKQGETHVEHFVGHPYEIAGYLAEAVDNYAKTDCRLVNWRLSTCLDPNAGAGHIIGVIIAVFEQMAPEEKPEAPPALPPQGLGYRCDCHKGFV